MSIALWPAMRAVYGAIPVHVLCHYESIDPRREPPGRHMIRFQRKLIQRPGGS